MQLGETPIQATRQFQQQLHSCDLGDQSGWLQSQQMPLTGDLTCPHTSSPHIAHSYSTRHIGSSLGIARPSSGLQLPVVSPQKGGLRHGFSKPSSSQGAGSGDRVWPVAPASSPPYSFICSKGLPEANPTYSLSLAFTSPVYRNPLLQAGQ